MKFAEKRFFSNPGRRTRPVYNLKYSIKTNAPELIQTGIEDWQAFIQSYKDGCDLNMIVKRIQNGDLSALTVRKGFYGDITEAPETLQDALNAKIAVDRAFDGLSEEQKKKFSSSEEFLATAGSLDWFEKLGVSIEIPESNKTRESNDSGVSE